MRGVQARQNLWRGVREEQGLRRYKDVMTDFDPPRSVDDESLWTAHAADLVRYATLLVGPNEAADVVSMAFIKVTSRTAAVANARAYLFRTVTNCAHDQRRGRQRRQARDLHAVLPTLGRQTESDLDVRSAVAALSVRQRAVVYFAYWEDLDEPGIAEVLGISAGSVRRHLARARVHLRKALT